MIGGLGNKMLTGGVVEFFRFDDASWISEQTVAAADFGGPVLFGLSVALDGDTALAGMQDGTPFIFRFDGLTWDAEQQLIPSDLQLADRYGDSVALAADIALVGAWGHDDNGQVSGAAYVFRFNGSSWTEGEKLLASDGQPAAFFGSVVAISGQAALIGAWNHGDSGAPGYDGFGAAYVFGGLSDCNGNVALDACDIADGTSPDDNGNGIPDECEGVIPTVSEWGLVVMTLLVLTAGTLVLARARARWEISTQVVEGGADILLRMYDGIADPQKKEARR